MEIFPAIDLHQGQVVRLFQGDYGQKTVYADDAQAVAESFKRQGARNLHLVDLNGADNGATVNLPLIEGLVKAGGLFIETGGGIRTQKRLDELLTLGVGRVILGTIALENRAFLADMVKLYGDKIAVGVDAKDGKVAVRGWREVSDQSAFEFCRQCADMGVSTIIYTDIATDGTLRGTNLAVFERLSQIKGLQIIASGGISFESEIVKLTDLGLHGAIVGKAIYTGKLDLQRLIRLADKEEKLC